MTPAEGAIPSGVTGLLTFLCSPAVLRASLYASYLGDNIFRVDFETRPPLDSLHHSLNSRDVWDVEFLGRPLSDERRVRFCNYKRGSNTTTCLIALDPVTCGTSLLDEVLA